MDKSEYVNVLITNITNMCAKRNISPNQLGIKSGTGKDIIANLQKGSIISSDKLSKIADHLDCSVDYLLGRTDEYRMVDGHSIKTGDITGDNNANINAAKEKSCSDSDETVSELVAIFKNLNFCDKVKVMSLVAELSEK